MSALRCRFELKMDGEKIGFTNFRSSEVVGLCSRGTTAAIIDFFSNFKQTNKSVDVSCVRVGGARSKSTNKCDET